MRVRRVGSVGVFQSPGEILTPGRTVRGRVVGKTGRRRFKISLGGWLLEADSDLPLEPGQILLARVDVQDDKILLRLQDDSGEDLEASDESENLRYAHLGRWISVIVK
jgi:hypothetical protein